jgi:hypothetical protein
LLYPFIGSIHQLRQVGVRHYAAGKIGSSTKDSRTQHELPPRQV